MIDRERAERLIAKRRALADAVENATRLAALAEALRSFYYPKQRAFFRSRRKRRATKKTRRSGATAGGCRELVARSIEHAGHRATYITGTLKDAKKRAWENDTKSGFVDVIRKYGKRREEAGVESYDLSGVTAWIRKGDMVIDFSNGSQIDLFGADNDGMADRLRGIAKHVFWIDEAQDLFALQQLYKDVIVAAMSDFDGECWLTGTPGRDCVGMFYEVTTDDEEPLAGWEVHRIAAVDNPFFGCVVWKDGQWFVVDNLAQEAGPYPDETAAEAAARDIRWERSAGAAIRENAWADDDPALLREYYARWVKEDARYVYALHAVPEHQIVYAPHRLGLDGFPDMQAAYADLPGRVDLREYFTGLGADLGTRDAFAFVVWAWSLRDPILYELASWKKTGLDYDEMAAYLHAVRAQINLSVVVADAGGGGKPAVMGWSKRWVDRYQIPIMEAKKSPGYKPIAIKQMNTEIRQHRILLRKDSPLMTEWKVHRWAPIRDAEGAEVEDPRTPNHCCLIAGTMIETEHGPQRIETITPGQLVWTRAGLRSVTAAWCTGERETWRVERDAGTLTGTADHPVWTESGWTDLSLLTTNAMLTTWESTGRPMSPSSMELSIAATHRVQIDRSACTSRALPVDACTVTSGPLPTDQYRAAITSTTSTGIRPTMRSKTSPASMAVSISARICVRPNESPRPGGPYSLPLPPRPCGIAQKPDEPGIPNTLVESWLIVRSILACAWSALAIFGRRPRAPGCAATHATQERGVTLESTTSPETASGAAASSVAAATVTSRTAVSRVVDVRRTGRVELVYNLTVEGEHEYFANGVLVSNCDGGLYGFLETYAHRFRPEPAKIVPGSTEWVLREERELEDAALDYERDR